MDQRLIDLFNRYAHGGMSRRAFLDRFAALAGGAAAASALLPLAGDVSGDVVVRLL